jgi:carboxypeptidase family protein
VDVTAHLRARAAQAGAFLAVLVGGIAAVPAAALANAPDVEITQLTTEVPSGGPVSLEYKVTNNNTNSDNPGDRPPTDTTIVITSGMRCTDGCGQSARIDADGGSKTFSAKFSAPIVDEGRSQDVSVTITATINGEPASIDGTVKVTGPDKPATVRQISGKVKNQDGHGLSGAKVAMRDSAGHAYETLTNNSGSYVFTSSDQQVIAPGAITVGAGKNDYQGKEVQIQASAGKSVNVPLTLTAIEASPSETPSASPSASPSAEPSTAETEETTPATALPSEGLALNNTSSDQGGGGGSLLFIILGGLLVAAGVGAIVLVVMRRKTGGDGDDDDPLGGGGPSGVVPPSQGRYGDATRVGAPLGAARGNDATMVAPLPLPPSIADAPTMLQRPVPAIEDEFPDPYGAPLPQQGGYLGTAGQNWDNQGGYEAPQQAGQYGGGYPAAPQPEDPYGSAVQPQVQQRYDEPTGLYQPQAADNGYDEYEPDGYAGGAQQYGGGYQGAGAYEQQQEPAAPGGYGPWGPQETTGYAPQAGGPYGGAGTPATGQYGTAGTPATGQYGTAGTPATGQYGAPGQYGAGYDETSGAYGGAPAAGGYDQGGYDHAAYEQGAYGTPQGGAHQQGQADYEEQHPGGPTRPAQRRPSEWDS